MKSFLVLSFYLTALALVSGRIFNENAPPRLRTTSAQNQLQKIHLLRSQSREELIGKIIYVKHLLELKCLKKIFNDIHNKNIQPYRMRISPLKNLQNRILNFDNMGPNFIIAEPQNRLNFGKNRIIFLPNRRQFVEKKANKFKQNKIPQSSVSEFISNQKSEKKPNFNEKKPNLKFIEFPRGFVDKHESSGKFLKENKKPNNLKLKPPTSTVDSYHSPQHTKPLRPHEVVEPAREDLKSGLFGQKKGENSHNNTSDRRNYLDSSFLGKGNERKTDKMKPQSSNKNSSSKNTVQKSSTESTKSSDEFFYNSYSHSGYLESALKNLNLYSDSGFSNFNKKTEKPKNPVNLQEQSKQLKITPPYFYEMNKKSKERSTKGTTESKIETNFTTTVKVENVKSIFTKKVTKAPSDGFKTKKFSNSVKNPEQTTAVPKIQTTSEFFDLIKDSHVQNVSIEDQKSNITTSLTLNVTGSTNKNLTELREGQLLKSQTTTTNNIKEFAKAKFSNPDSWDKITETPELKKDIRKMKSGTNFSAEKMPIFTEFTDLPLSIDLLTTRKKDQDTVFKNSRKMHFDQEILTTTMSNKISNAKDIQHRRSDILIDENLDDYLLYDGSFTSNYLKKLRQKNFLNSTSHSIIELIPFVIHDLREKKISPEDIQILSKAFGNYWTTVLALSNNTNLDMLPLLKMKDEKDLNNILRTFFPESTYMIPTELSETANNNYLEYYYENEYEDLKEDQSVLRGREETFKFKRDEEDSRYFDSVKEEQILENKYKYKSMLMSEVPDLNINVDYVTSRTNKVL